MDWIRTNKDPGHDNINFSINEHLVYTEQMDELFIVMRSTAKYPQQPSSTFLTLKVQKEDGGTMESYKYPLNTSMFVGTNHSFAIATSPHFNPNSVYFTDYDDLREEGDVGIYHCDSDTVSNFYYPLHPTTTTTNTCIHYAPIWFTPTLT